MERILRKGRLGNGGYINGDPSPANSLGLWSRSGPMPVVELSSGKVEEITLRPTGLAVVASDGVRWMKKCKSLGRKNEWRGMFYRKSAMSCLTV